MGLTAALLMILFEAIRRHVWLAFARANEVPPVEKLAASPLEEELVEAAEDAPAEELQFDGDVGMFGGDFADPIGASPLAQGPASGNVEQPEPENDDKEAGALPASPEIPAQIELSLSEAPAPAAPREDKQRRGEREPRTDRRSRKAEKHARAGGTVEESRKRARKNRDAPDDARASRQQNRRKNKQ
jgi:hypothetical protein